MHLLGRPVRPCVGRPAARELVTAPPVHSAAPRPQLPALALSRAPLLVAHFGTGPSEAPSSPKSIQQHQQSQAPTRPTLEHGTAAVTFILPLSMAGSKSSVLRGSWSNFTQDHVLTKPHAESDWQVTVALRPGQHSFKFVVDGTWIVVPGYLQAVDFQNNVNNIVVVGAPTEQVSPAAHTLEDELANRIAGREAGNQHSGGSPSTSNPPATFAIYCKVAPGQRVQAIYEIQAGSKDLVHTEFVTPLDAPEWRMAYIPLAKSGSPLKFYLQQTDPVPPQQQHQVIHHPQWRDVCPKENGGFWSLSAPVAVQFDLADKTSAPHPRRFSRGERARMMLSLDIDGTLFGHDHPETSPLRYASSQRLTEALAHNRVVGSVIVYNTGRSLGMTETLEALAGPGKVPKPHFLITAVGTKVFRRKGAQTNTPFNPKQGESAWEEDLVFSRLLNHGWNLDNVRKVGWGIVRAIKNEDHCKVIDDGSEHPHRFSLLVAEHLLPQVRKDMEEGLRKEGVQARMCESGGGRKFLDVVAVNGGKESALQYVRQLCGIMQEHTVAAGDSGNDLAMLEGQHPAILVGNAQADMQVWSMTLGGNERVVHANGHYSDGVVEGLLRLNLL